MENWKEYRLGEIVDYYKGYAFNSDLYIDDGVMVVRVSDFTLDSISCDNAVYIEESDKYEKFRLLENDILIQTVGSWANNPNSIVGKVVRVPATCYNSYLNQNIVKIFPNSKGLIDNAFLFYYLKATKFAEYCVIRGQGAANQASITLNTIFRYPINVPSLFVQTKIASTISAYDNLIENNNKRIKLLEQMAENLYKEWFVRFRFPGHETTPFENGIPKGWSHKRISDFYETSSGGTPSRERTDFYENGTVPWIKTGELQDSIIIETEEKITETAVKKSAAKIIPANSILMAMYGVNIGMLAYTSIIATCNQACCVFKDKKDISTKHYLFYFLKSIRNYLLTISFGAAQQNISQDLIKRIKILVPNDSILKKFESTIDPIYNHIIALNKQNQNLIKQRDLLLPRLMSGKLAV